MAEPVEVLFGFRWCPRSPRERGNFGGMFLPLKCNSAVEAAIAEAAELSVGNSTSQQRHNFRMDLPAVWDDKCGGDVAFHQNSLTTCLYQLCIAWVSIRSKLLHFLWTTELFRLLNFVLIVNIIYCECSWLTKLHIYLQSVCQLLFTQCSRVCFFSSNLIIFQCVAESAYNVSHCTEL